MHMALIDQHLHRTEEILEEARKGKIRREDTDELGLTCENSRRSLRSCSRGDLLMPAASAFFDEDGLGAQWRRRGAMEASGEEEGEGRWREREREFCARPSTGIGRIVLQRHPSSRRCRRS